MIPCPKCNVQNAPGSSFCMNCGAPLTSETASETIGSLRTRYEGVNDTESRASSEAIDLEPGTLFAGRYRIERKIGQGGMGVVYLATETLAGQDRAIALKLIRADRLADRKALDRLIREGALTQQIRHRNVVAVYNVGEVDGQAFVAMDYVEGVSLREWHRRQLTAKAEIPFKTIVSILREILAGLEAAHDLQIIHRDLKPENVILTADPDPDGTSLQILDFGIARAPGANETVTGTGLGTPRYMAPEQITNPGTAGPPADIYSLSIMFYELLMDVLPQGHWQPPSGGRGDVPATIDKLIEKGLSSRPASRQPTVGAYREELDSCLAGTSRDQTNKQETLRKPNRLMEGNLGETYQSHWQQMLSTTGGKVSLGLSVLVGGAIILASTNSELFEETDQRLHKQDVWIDGRGGGTEPADGDTIADTDETGNQDTVNDTGNDKGGTTSNKPIGVVNPTSPPPPQSPFTKLAGIWNDGMGGIFRITVNDEGSFFGNGSAAGAVYRIEGSIPGGKFVGNINGQAFSGPLQWDGACHIAYQTYAQNTLISEGKFHIDHNPGAACPARFAQ